MKYSYVRNCPKGLDEKAQNRFRKMAKTDMLMRVSETYPEIKKGYIEFKNGFNTDGSSFIELVVTILEKEN